MGEFGLLSRRRNHRGQRARLVQEQRAIGRVRLEHLAKAQSHGGGEALWVLVLGQTHGLAQLGRQRVLFRGTSRQGKQQLCGSPLCTHESHDLHQAGRASEIGIAMRHCAVKVGIVYPGGKTTRGQQQLERARKVDAQPAVEPPQRPRHARVFKGGVQRTHLGSNGLARRRGWPCPERARGDV